jgi:thioredoxin 1
MKKIISTLNLFLLIFVLQSCNSESANTNPVKSDSVTAATENNSSELIKFLQSENSSEVAVIKFYADWCGTCRKYAPTFEAVSTEMTTAKAPVNFYEINVDNKEYLPLLRELKVSMIPVTYFVSKDRTKVFKQLGPIQADSLKDKINTLVKE